MSEESSLNLVELTADLASAYLSNNDLKAADVPELIRSMHEALSGLGAAEAPAQPDRPEPAVTARKSLADPSRILSMIDGKPYTTLKRHIAKHGYTPESYRETFGLKADYPMVAPGYSEKRSAFALQSGFGRKAKAAVSDAKKAVKQGGGLKNALIAAKSHLTGEAPVKGGRGRPKKVPATAQQGS